MYKELNKLLDRGSERIFLKIIHNKFYKNVHKGVQHGKVDCDYFFLDYNGIVYNAYENIKKKYRR